MLAMSKYLEKSALSQWKTGDGIARKGLAEVSFTAIVVEALWMDNPCPGTPMLVSDPWLYFWLLPAPNPALMWELVHSHGIGSLHIPRSL